MTLLSQVTKGRVKQPVLAMVYGVDGAGKTTLAAGAPNTIFLGTEKGTSHLDVARFPTPSTFKDVLKAIDELTKDKHDFETLAIDSLDWLEPLVWEQVCMDANVKHIEEFGYGKGYVIANKLWMEMISKLARLRETRHMNVILIAHSQVKLTKDPQTQSEYDRYQLKLNDKAAAIWRESVDAVLFMNFEIVIQKENKKTKAFGDGTRYLFTERRPGFDAKNRYGLPFQIELSQENPWGDFMRAYRDSQPDDSETLRTQIQEKLLEIKDEALKTKVQESLEKAQNNQDALERIYNRLRTIAA